MTTKEVKNRIKEIIDGDGDYEMQHGKEDDLYLDFVRLCAAEAPEPFCSLAKEILKTRKLDFSRLCA